MDQAVEQASLLEHVLLVSEEELKKATSKGQDQPSEKISVPVDTENKDGHIDQNKGDIPDTPKEEEEQAMHTLVNLPLAGTPTKSQQESSTVAVPLQISTPSSSHSRVAKVLHYGDAFLDENIVIPHFDSATMTLDDLNILQAAIKRRTQPEIMRKEYRQKNAMQNIKDIFLDALFGTLLDESKDIVEQLLDIVDQVQDADLDTNAKLLEWSERKFQSKVNEKIATKIALSQVELAKKIKRVSEVLGKILSLYTK